MKPSPPNFSRVINTPNVFSPLIYDLNIVCFNSINLIGNGFTIPSGPLRDKLNILKKYNIVFINGNEENYLSMTYHDQA